MRFARLFAVFFAVSFATAVAFAHPVGEATATGAISVRQVEGERFELVYAGERFTSRDSHEALLLVRAAELARQRDRDWFLLVQMPDEQPGQHPARTDTSYGAQYGHWQPHWYYRVEPDVWQPWHPEWGDRFWATEIDPAQVTRFEVHAMVELGSGTPPDVAEVFDAAAIVEDLKPKLATLEH